MALSDAKGDVDDRVRDLAASERELEKADFDLRYKTHEAKLVNKAAVAKRTEVGEVCTLLAHAANAIDHCSGCSADQGLVWCPENLHCVPLLRAFAVNVLWTHMLILALQTKQNNFQQYSQRYAFQ